MEKIKSQVCLYSSLKKTDGGKRMDLSLILKYIQEGHWKDEILKLRSVEDAEQQKRYKNSLPYFTPSGLFDQRKESGLILHSNYICIDIDNLTDPEKTKEQVAKDQYTQVVFLSCRGKGLAVLVKIDGSRHKESFVFLKKYYQDTYNLKIDSACSDVSRARLASYDTGLIYNENAIELSLPQVTPPAPVATVSEKENVIPEPSQAGDSMSDSEKYELVKTIQEKTKNYTDGERHAYLISLGYFLNKVGVPLDYALRQTVADYAVPTKTEQEIRSIINHCYKKTEEHSTHPLNKNTTAAPKCGGDENLKAIYRYVNKMNRDGEKWKESDVEFLSDEHRIAKDVIRNIFEFIYKTNENEHGINHSPTIKQVEVFLQKNYEFRKNVVTQEQECRRSNAKQFEKMNLNTLYRELQHARLSFSLPKLKSLVESNFINEYDPFRAYFDSLPAWDGTDYIGQLASYVKTENQEFFLIMFIKMLVRCIACSVFHKENRIVFVLVSEKQEMGKSTFLRFLSPFKNEYYTEAPLRDTKDTEFKFAENYFFNLEELSSLNNIEVNRLKSIISITTIKERKPYAYGEVSQPRRCNFVGSTNKEEFLTDSVNTRWLCFRIQDINWDYRKEIAIHKVWAQAYHLYKTGFDYQLTREEQKMREATNKGYEVRTAESDLITKYLIACSKDDEGGEFMDSTEINAFLCKASEKKGELNRFALGRAMSQLGFTSAIKRRNKKSVRGYYVKISERFPEYNTSAAKPLFNLEV